MKIRDIIEEVEEPMHVYHGGSYSGGDYNPHSVGEPGNLRPLGKGLYTAITPEHAGIYVKYAGEGGKVTKFQVSSTAKIYPWGRAAWEELSEAEAAWWRAKSKEIQKAFEEAGLVRYDDLNKEYRSWSLVVSGSSMHNGGRDSVRQLLVKCGIDGSKEVLGNGMVEIVFYNVGVLTPVNN